MTKIFKKSLAFVIALALLVSCLIIPGMVGAVADELDIWDGTFAKPVDVDDDGYFEVFTPEELAWVVKNNGRQGEGESDPAAKIELMNDIWLNDMLVKVIDGVPTATKATDTSVVIDLNDDENNGLNEWFDGWVDPRYVGSEIKGNGHVVNGLYLKTDIETTGVGLIPRIGSALTITDLGLENSYIDNVSTWQAGLILGSVHYAKAVVKNCYTGAPTFHKNTGKGGAIVGGGGKGAKVVDCYSLTSFKLGSSDSGAIVGDSWGASSMTRCYVANYDKFNRPGCDNPTDCYVLTSAPGAEALSVAPCLGASYYVTNGYPALKVFNPEADTALWNGFLERPGKNANGEFEVYTPYHFAFATSPHAQKATFVLMNDIVVNDMKVVVTNGEAKLYDSEENEITDTSVLTKWHTNQAAVSTVRINGNGHTVRGIFSDYTFENPADGNTMGLGLINKGWDVDITGLRLEDMYINAHDTTASALIANVWSQTGNDIKSCYIGESVYISGKNASGIFGCGSAANMVNTVDNTVMLATLKGTNKVGSITGDIWSCGKYTVKNSIVTHGFWGNNPGSVTTSYHVADKGTILGNKAISAMPALTDYAVTATYPVPTVFDKSGVWGGFLASGFAGGTGTKADPWLIADGAQLARAVNIARSTYVEEADGAYYYNETDKVYALITDEAFEGTRYAAPSFKLTADIYLNDLSKINWTNGDVAEGYVARNWYDDITVQGNFEGDGHMVYGIYKKRINATEYGVCGTALFPQVAANTTLNVHGIGVDYSFICGWQAGSAFVGAGPNSNDTSIYAIVTIDESFVGQNTTIKGYDAGAAIGINRGIKGTVTNFYSLATLVGYSETGIVADMWGVAAVMDKVYNGNGSIDTKNDQHATNSYATAAGSDAVVLPKEGMMGTAALASMYALGDKFVATDTFPSLKLFVENYDEDKVLGGPLFIGAGTEEDPYLIITATDLKNMVGISGKGAYYKLTNDIYVNDVNAVDWLTGEVNEGFEPDTWFVSNDKDGRGYASYVGTLSTFTGHIDGAGYAVHGIYYELGNKSTLAGLLPFAKDTSIKNLGIEDSFIGGGRFTGGFIGKTPDTANTVTISNSYIDHTCTVMGWDAGAAYVTADNQIGTGSDGSKLCVGAIHHYEYAEAENGTYILDGETYRKFTAADYEGTKYAYDEETGTYTESAEGTYRLDGENYVLITIADYVGTKYAVSDIVWGNTVHFTANALGGMIARLGSKSTANIDNCYVTANVVSNGLKIFGSNDQGVTFNEENTSGAGIGHQGGIWGDDWDATANITNCFSIMRPHEHHTNAASNLYTLAEGFNDSRVTVSNAIGAEGLAAMSALSTDVWYAVTNGYPSLQVRGNAIADINCDGDFDLATDGGALRVAILDNAATLMFGDRNNDAKINICDLVALYK